MLRVTCVLVTSAVTAPPAAVASPPLHPGQEAPGGRQESQAAPLAEGGRQHVVMSCHVMSCHVVMLNMVVKIEVFFYLPFIRSDRISIH